MNKTYKTIKLLHCSSLLPSIVGIPAAQLTDDVTVPLCVGGVPSHADAVMTSRVSLNRYGMVY